MSTTRLVSAHEADHRPSHACATAMNSGSGPGEPYSGVYREDLAARAVYSEAAGIGRVMPHAVAVPHGIDDVIALVRWANASSSPLVPRGSGSSMPGGAIGSGTIVDLSRLRSIGVADARTRRIVVGAGAIRNRVDEAARSAGLRFPVDPSSGEFCSIGGMVRARHPPGSFVPCRRLHGGSFWNPRGIRILRDDRTYRDTRPGPGAWAD